jgi:tRNA threonylcarbamoyladenosine biosynthesis protein TsaB
MAFNPRLLILETSGRIGWVAIGQGPELLASRKLDDGRRNARDLAPAVHELLECQNWQTSDLAGVIINVGPGRYTGLRVGIMAAKTLSYATGCALLGIESFAAVACQTPSELNRIDVVGDAQQDKIYHQPFARENNGWKALAPLAIRSFPQWVADLPGKCWVTGPGLTKWANKLSEAVSRLAEEVWDPKPQSLLKLGFARFLAGERDDPFSLEPLYLRPSSAEEQWGVAKFSGDEKEAIAQ